MDYYGGESGGYRGGGGGRHHNNRRGRGGGGRGRGRGYRHSPYGGGRGGRGPRRPGNRFQSQTSVHPETKLLQQVASFVSRVGELKNLSISEENAHGLRDVEATTARNITDLVPVLCAPDKLPMLLSCNATSDKPEEQAGKLVHLVVSCAAALPLQTPAYAALTLALHHHVNLVSASEGVGSQAVHFAAKCVDYTMAHIGRDLDMCLMDSESQATLGQATCRLKLLLRYLTILGRVGMIHLYIEGEQDVTVDPGRMTLFGLLKVFVSAAEQAAKTKAAPAAHWLALLVLSTLPYLLEVVPRDIVLSSLLQPLQDILKSYNSTFVPGTGLTALLLKHPQRDEDDNEEDDDEEEEEEEDENDDASGQICDNLQDLLRTCQRWKKNDKHETTFLLPKDSPWLGLVQKSIPVNPSEGADPEESQLVVYKEETMYLKFAQECQSLNHFVGGSDIGELKIQCLQLQGAVFGRLPIFGSPSDPEIEEEDEEDDMEDNKSKNEHLQAFQDMSLQDRYMVAEAMRDCLICHLSLVTPTGVQHGHAKSAAEELLSVRHMFAGDKPSAGIEYAMLETLFALLAQAQERSTLKHIFLSRVLLELTRLEPSRLSPALAVAMTNLFRDYLPALVPSARENFSRWFAFHLVNTDYQWPSAYWQLWEPYAVSSKESSRGTFIRRALNLLAENVSDPSALVKECLSSSPSLKQELLCRSPVPLPALEPDSPMGKLEAELRRRVLDNSEDPSLVAGYIVGDEVGSALTAAASLGADQANGGSFPRTDSLARVVLDPARELQEALNSAIERVENSAGADEADGMVEEGALSRDILESIANVVSKYKATILGAISKDAENLSALSGGDKDEITTIGGGFLLRRVQSMTSFSPSLMEAVVSLLVQNGVVNAMEVLRWALGDLGDATAAAVVPRWWFFATEAAQVSVALVESEVTAGGVMSVDANGLDSSADFASQVGSGLSQMLRYSISRVCGMLVAAQGAGNALSPGQVDLLEGMKAFAFNCKSLLISALATNSGIRKPMQRDAVGEMIASSEMSGSALTGLCTGQEGSSTVSLLGRSLEHF